MKKISFVAIVVIAAVCLAVGAKEDRRNSTETSSDPTIVTTNETRTVNTTSAKEDSNSTETSSDPTIVTTNATRTVNTTSETEEKETARPKSRYRETNNTDECRRISCGPWWTECVSRCFCLGSGEEPFLCLSNETALYYHSSRYS
uniref:Putative secreted peptide n=1 Tax=Rhipicephalus pulchellus TaxID=72859 RepID=L7M9N1_RHIPC